jgi:hypothetical protein
MHAQTPSGGLIDDRQNSKPSSVRQSLTHKVHAPTLVRKSGFGKRDSHLGGTFALLRPHRQRLFPILPVNAFCIYSPTFSPQYHRQSSISVADPRAGQIPQPDAKLGLGSATALVTIQPTRDAHQPASAVCTQLIRLSYFAHQLPTLGAGHTFLMKDAAFARRFVLTIFDGTMRLAGSQHRIGRSEMRLGAARCKRQMGASLR